MAGLVRRRETPDKRLVLGFDAGCMTCSELARRIEEQVGDKLEIRSLRDPQVQEWRRRVLGDDAPWVPTLIEVEGTRIRAWTGRSMGLALGRSLGPIRTWRVMQVLGEVSVGEGETSNAAWPGLTRGQFIKGVGGAVVAMSVLSGAGGLALGAATKSPSSSRDKAKAKDLVTSSDQFKAIQKGNAPFDFNKAEYKLTSDHGVVGVPSLSDTRIIVAVFYIDLRRNEVYSYDYSEYIPSDKNPLPSDLENSGRDSHKKSDKKKFVFWNQVSDGKVLGHSWVGHGYVGIISGRHVYWYTDSQFKQLMKYEGKNQKAGNAGKPPLQPGGSGAPQPSERSASRTRIPSTSATPKNPRSGPSGGRTSVSPQSDTSGRGNSVSPQYDEGICTPGQACPCYEHCLPRAQQDCEAAPGASCKITEQLFAKPEEIILKTIADYDLTEAVGQSCDFLFGPFESQCPSYARASCYQNCFP